MSPGNQDILQQPADRVHFAPETIETTHSFKEDIPQLLYRDDIKKGDRMQPDYVHEVIFVIRQKNMDKLTLMLHDISDPLSANYGYHLSGDEIATLTSNPESLNAVANFLVLNGVSAQSQSLHGEYLTANATVLIWEEMLNTEFYSFDVLQNKKVEAVVRAERYWIPKELELHVESVFNTIQIPRVIYGDLGRIRSQGLRTEIVAPGVVTPAKLKQFYNITTKGSARSTQGIFATIHLYFSPADLASFQTQLAPPAYPVSTIIGNHSSDSFCIQTPGSCAEPNLDLQYMMSMSPGSPTTYWYTDQSFTDWLVSVAAYPNRPLVFSISYGSSESSMSGSELNAFNTQMIKLGAMGVTVVVATGDDGANSPEVRSSSYGTSACGYSPVFPASSPYVTSVGATKVSY